MVLLGVSIGLFGFVFIIFLSNPNRTVRFRSQSVLNQAVQAESALNQKVGSVQFGLLV